MVPYDEYTTFVKAYKLFESKPIETSLRYKREINDTEDDQFYP
jgi:hypothetical protein